MKKSIIIISAFLLLLVAFYQCCLSGSQNACPYGKKVTEQDWAGGPWLKATLSFTLKGSNGEDYGLTFRWK